MRVVRLLFLVRDKTEYDLNDAPGPLLIRSARALVFFCRRGWRGKVLAFWDVDWYTVFSDSMLMCAFGIKVLVCENV